MTRVTGRRAAGSAAELDWPDEDCPDKYWVDETEASTRHSTEIFRKRMAPPSSWGGPLVLDRTQRAVILAGSYWRAGAVPCRDLDTRAEVSGAWMQVACFEMAGLSPDERPSAS